MSEPSQSLISARDIKTRAAEWLMERRFAENWSVGDEARLQDWLSQSLAHRVAFVRLEAAWTRTDRLAALRPSGSAPATRLASRPILMRLMASVGALAIVGGVIGIIMLTPREATYATSVGGHATIKLADGSRIELNTTTRLRVGPDQRSAVLESGEAYFQIKHDATHPFVVLAGDHRVVDLGTKFMVRADSGRLEVGLVEGRARLESADAWIQQHKAVLTPGDVAVATTSSLSVKRTQQKVLTNALGWRSGVLIFDHSSLANAATEFNRYNRTKLVIGDAAVAKLTIYGTFRADNIEDFVSLAHDVLGLRAERRGEEIRIFQ